MVDYHRSVTDVVNGDSLLFPFQVFCTDFDDPRNSAIIEVLRRIPPADFQSLEELVESFTWYIPAYETLAGVMPFVITHPGEPIQDNGLSQAPYARVVYLAPLMEDVELDVAVAAVAHELTHIFLDHKVQELADDEYKRQEDEAWGKVREWGFTQEIEAHKKYRTESDE